MREDDSQPESSISRKPANTSPGSARPSLSLVIPCYNEAHRLPETLRTLTPFCEQWPGGCEVILVDDGSTDATRQVIESAGRDRAFVRLAILPSNRGKGAALREGVRRTTGRVVLFFDADLSYPLETVPRALSEIERGADLVIGARDLGRVNGTNGGEPLLRRISHRAFATLVDLYLDLGIPDTQCGFKAFRGPVGRSLFSCLTVNRFAFDVELLALARHWGLQIQRIPVTPLRREGSSVRLVRDSLEMWRALASIRRRIRQGRYPGRPTLLED